MSTKVTEAVQESERFDILRIMATLILRSADLVRVRFAFSPLWESVAAFRTWQGPRGSQKRRQWAGLFEPAKGQSEWPLLKSIALAPVGTIPDFLAPPPKNPFVSLTDELEELRSTPVDVVVAELQSIDSHVLNEFRLRGRRGVQNALDNLADELRIFWRYAIAPLWPRVVACLEAEIVYRSRILAFGGASTVLNGLHPDVSFVAKRNGGLLHVRTVPGFHQRKAGSGLLLVPSVFAWPGTYAVVRPPWQPTLAYPARGIDELWPAPLSRTSNGHTRLATLVGAPAARLLHALVRPRTTTEVARILRIAPSSVSRLVTALNKAGYVHRARSGRRVYYWLSESGHAVLQA